MAISLDLRERVLAAYEQGEGTIVDLAIRFKVSTASITRWRRLKRETGSAERRRHGGGMPRAVDDDELRVIVEEEPDATLDELTQAYNAWMEAAASRSAVNRALDRLGITRKKRQSTRTNGAPSESSS